MRRISLVRPNTAESQVLTCQQEATDGTPGDSKDKKRKSLGGVPEHKSKKLNKKKSMPTLHLDCKPGEFYWARLKGYPPWPAVICDESMLPESLLGSRPVSTARPDGSLRDDFKEGGKNAKERTFPIMFMFTNELCVPIKHAVRREQVLTVMKQPMDEQHCIDAARSRGVQSPADIEDDQVSAECVQGCI